MIKVSGVNFWPSEVESVLLKHPEVGPEYQIIVERVGGADRLTVVVESRNVMSSSEKQEVATKLKNELRDVLLFTPLVEIVDPGQLPRVEVGKAKRVIDTRQNT
jgi:phenylacetate-CoA ligase